MLYATLLLYRKEKLLLLTRNGFCAFSIYTFEQSYGAVDGDSASSSDEGIEILTGKDAGEKQSEETYFKGAINFLVNEKLKKFAEGLKAFGEKEEILNHERL